MNYRESASVWSNHDRKLWRNVFQPTPVAISAALDRQAARNENFVLVVYRTTAATSCVSFNRQNTAGSRMCCQILAQKTDVVVQAQAGPEHPTGERRNRLKEILSNTSPSEFSRMLKSTWFPSVFIGGHLALLQHPRGYAIGHSSKLIIVLSAREGENMPMGQFCPGAGSPDSGWHSAPDFYKLHSVPIFEYECRQCGHRFEYLVLHSSPVAECPACRQQDLDRLTSLCTVSSETSRQANLGAAHRKAAAVRGEKSHQSHTHMHEHFEDRPTAGTDRKASPK